MKIASEKTSRRFSRRNFLARTSALSTASLLGVRADAAQSKDAWRIGYLSGGRAKDAAPYLGTFLEGLHALGYIEGQNVLVERRFAEGRFEALPALAEDLAHLKVDVIVAPQTPAARAAKAVTSSIPIVFVVASDPVGSGLVASFPYPGGNVTGTTDMGVELAAKRLQMLKQVVPRLKRVGTVGDPADPLWEPVWREAQVAAHGLQIDLTPVLIATQGQLETAFSEINGRVEALLVGPHYFFSVNRRRLVELALRAKLPSIYDFRGYTESGGLMSYGADNLALFRKAAHCVDKILKGARPAELPVEQPTDYELVVNLKTAKALGLTIPESFLLSATKVIR